MKPYDKHMRSCPKCGSYAIRGPKYQPDHMVWNCIDCGYIEHTACKDAEEADREQV